MLTNLFVTSPEPLTLISTQVSKGVINGFRARPCSLGRIRLLPLTEPGPGFDHANEHLDALPVCTASER